MPDYEYNVVPFIGQVKGGKFTSFGASEVAGQLQTLITSNSTGGWEFYRIDQIQVQVNPGCLGALFGQKASWISFDQVTFRKPR